MYLLSFKFYFGLNFFQSPFFFQTSLFFFNCFVLNNCPKGFYFGGVVDKMGHGNFGGLQKEFD